MNEARLRVVFMGTSGFAVPALERLLLGGYEIAAVYTQPDRPAGRGKALSPPPVKLVALARDLEVRQPAKLRAPSEVEALAALEPDAIVVAAYGQLLPQSVLDIPKHGCLNIHPSLLPLYRGPTPVASAILAGDSETGVTVMLLDAGMDTGPTLSQMIVGIEPDDTTESLTKGLAEAGARLLAETIELWFDGSLKAQPQDESRATTTRTFNKEDGAIDWRLSAVDISRRIRAFHPWPGSYSRWRGKSLKILEAVPLGDNVTREPGRVVSPATGQPAAGVQTGDGVLGLVTVQLEGRRPVAAAEFVRGHREFVGDLLGSG